MVLNKDLQDMAENVLRKIVVEEPDGSHRLNSAYEQSEIAMALLEVADILERWRGDRKKFHELQETNRKLGADLLKSQAQLVALQKDKHALQIKVDDLNDELIKNSGKQTRLDILNKRLLEMESERNTYKYCYEFLAVQHKKES